MYDIIYDDTNSTVITIITINITTSIIDIII